MEKHDLRKIAFLIDFYGKLLTEKKIRYLKDYYFNDYTINEIAEQNNITKIAVFDSIKKSLIELEKYEEKLRFIENFNRRLVLYKEIEDKEIVDKLMKTEVLDIWKK